MLRLLLFVPCEKPIIAIDQQLSLVGLIERIAISVPPGVPVPPEASVSQVWHIFALYAADESEINKSYRQIIHLKSPDGEEVMSSSFTFTVNALSIRNQSRVEEFPVAQQGTYLLRLTLVHDNDDESSSVVIEHEYPIRVAHMAAEPPAESQ